MGRSRRDVDGVEESGSMKELRDTIKKLRNDNKRLELKVEKLQAKLDEEYGVEQKPEVEVRVVEEKKRPQLKKLCEKCSSSAIKEIFVPNVGTIQLCPDCQHRKVTREKG